MNEKFNMEAWVTEASFQELLDEYATNLKLPSKQLDYKGRTDRRTIRAEINHRTENL